MSSDRQAAGEEVFTRLFGPRDTSAPDDNPEFGEILRAVIFGDVFATGELDDRTRELVTVTAIASLQALPQLKAHATAALRVGVTPVELQEAMYQLAPFIGFPRALNAVSTVDEVLRSQGVELPLPRQASVDGGAEQRHEQGLAIQDELYGAEIAESLAGLPEPFDDAVPGFLTDFLFGDFWTRGGLDVATRELLALVTLAALGLAPQLPSHVEGAIRAGNSREKVLAVLVQAFPYIGFPNALNAIRQVLAVGGTH